MDTLTARILQILIALDCLMFALLTLGNVKRGETMSAAAWSLEQSGKWQGKLMRPLIDCVFFFDPQHCAVSYINEHRWGLHD